MNLHAELFVHTVGCWIAYSLIVKERVLRLHSDEINFIRFVIESATIVLLNTRVRKFNRIRFSNAARSASHYLFPWQEVCAFFQSLLIIIFMQKMFASACWATARQNHFSIQFGNECVAICVIQSNGIKRDHNRQSSVVSQYGIDNEQKKKFTLFALSL